jgi:hypothetical protein
VPQLPEVFTKFEVRDLAIKAEPKLAGKIKDNALAGTMRSLVEENLIYQVTEATGRRAATYSRKKPIKEVVAGLFQEN